MYRFSSSEYLYKWIHFTPCFQGLPMLYHVVGLHFLLPSNISLCGNAISYLCFSVLGNLPFFSRPSPPLLMLGRESEGNGARNENSFLSLKAGTGYHCVSDLSGRRQLTWLCGHLFGGEAALGPERVQRSGSSPCELPAHLHPLSVARGTSRPLLM